MLWLKTSLIGVLIALVVNVPPHSKLIGSFQGHLSAHNALLAAINWFGSPFSKVFNSKKVKTLFTIDAITKDFHRKLSYTVQELREIEPEPVFARTTAYEEWGQFFRGRMKQCKQLKQLNRLIMKTPRVSLEVWPTNGKYLSSTSSQLGWFIFHVSTNFHRIKYRISSSWVDLLSRSVKGSILLFSTTEMHNIIRRCNLPITRY